jgi:hypothetical protein
MISSQGTFDQSAVVDAHDHPVTDETPLQKVPKISVQRPVLTSLYTSETNLEAI